MIEYNLQEQEPTKDEILFIANTNGYRLFANELSPNELVDKDLDASYLPFDPFTLMLKQKFDNVRNLMIDYFIEEEDYEKCAFLRDYTYSKYYIDFRYYDPIHGLVKGKYIDPISGKRPD
tara:strand:+ start:587 stop:946 length:360 start_codon:yes stop_codon:yes gene_type:complete